MQKPEQELNKEKKKWTKQQKKKYLEFITHHLISLEGRVPNNFFKIMENAISNNKTSRQLIDFHNHRKHGCSSIQDLINKLSKQIDQDPAVFINNHEQTIKRQNEKISCFEGFKEAKSLTEVANQEFLKYFNPYEIIFRPNEKSLNQIMLNEGKKETDSSSDSLHYRQLQTKLYPIKDNFLDSEEEKEKEKCDSQSQAQDFLSQDFRNKKRIIFKKRQQKDQEQPIQTSQSKYWNDAQYLKFLVFLMYYKSQFSSDSQKKKIGLMIKMSKFLKTRDLEACNSCWQYFYSKCKNIDGVIGYLQKTVNVSKEQIYEEISNIQDFYQQELQQEMVSLNPVKFSLWAPGSNNESLIRQIIKANIEFSSLTEKMSECKLEAGQQALKVQNQQIKVELPITFEVFLIKQSKQAKNNQNQIRKEKEKEKNKKIDKEKVNEEDQDQNEDQDNIDKKRVYRRKKASDETKNKSRKTQEIYFQDNSIKDTKYVQKIKKTKIKWSISQNLKFVAYLIVNRYYFENLDAKDRNGIIIKLAQFLQTGKSIDQCSVHLGGWKQMNDKDINKAIEQKSKKFGLTEQMIEERKKICGQIKTIKTKMEDATLQLDHLPTKICIKKENFSEQTVLSKIYESEPYLSFYLRFQGNERIEKNKADQEKKTLVGQECGQAKGQLSSKIIKTTLKLGLLEPKFQKLKKYLQKNSEKDVSAQNLVHFNDVMRINIQGNIIFEFIYF